MTYSISGSLSSPIAAVNSDLISCSTSLFFSITAERWNVCTCVWERWQWINWHVTFFQIISSLLHFFHLFSNLSSNCSRILKLLYRHREQLLSDVINFMNDLTWMVVPASTIVSSSCPSAIFRRCSSSFLSYSATAITVFSNWLLRSVFKSVSRHKKTTPTCWIHNL